MKLGLQMLLIAGLALALLYFVCRFAVSDFLYPDIEALHDKPWRPMARLAFGAVAVPLILFFTFVFTKVCFRYRGNQ